MKVFLTPIGTEGLKCSSTPLPPPEARSDCCKLLDHSEEATEEGLAVGLQ